MALLRVGLGLQVTVYSLSLWNDWIYLFAANSDSLISRDLSEAILSLDSSFIPRLGWLVTLGGQMGLSEQVTLRLSLLCMLGSGVCLLLGLFSRPAAIAAWLLHLAARSSGGLTAYGVDYFMTIGLFYLMLCPLPDCYSLDYRLWKRRTADPRRIGFHQRVLQLHLCLIYFFGGLGKSLGRLVEWRQHLAVPDPFALQCHFAGSSLAVEQPFAVARNCYLHPGNRLPDFYLAKEDAHDLARCGVGNARSHRRDDGSSSFRAHYDRAERRRFRSGIDRAASRKDGIFTNTLAAKLNICENSVAYLSAPRRMGAQ